MFFDEPGKFLGSLQSLFIKIIKEISEKLNIIFVIVTHDDSIINEADKVFYVEQKDGISSVTSEGDVVEEETKPIIRRRK